MPAEFKFDEDFSYFMVRLPVHPAALEVAESQAGGLARPRSESRPESRPESGPESGLESGLESGVESEIAKRILELLRSDVLGKSEIAQRLGKSKPTRYLNDLVRKMLEAGLIEYTLPEKPNSRLQKYRLAPRQKRA